MLGLLGVAVTYAFNMCPAVAHGTPKNRRPARRGAAGGGSQAHRGRSPPGWTAGLRSPTGPQGRWREVTGVRFLLLALAWRRGEVRVSVRLSVDVSG